MKKNLLVAFCLLAATMLNANTLWNLSKSGICLKEGVCCNDHLEMSGEQISCVLRWGVDANGAFHAERSLVFPMLRTIPNNTHASLNLRMAVDIPSLLNVDGGSLLPLNTTTVELDGYVRVVGNYGSSRKKTSTVEISRRIFPSTTRPMLVEIYNVTNTSKEDILLYIPDYTQKFTTPAQNGVKGSYDVRADIVGNGSMKMAPGESVSFGAVFQAGLMNFDPQFPDLEEEFSARMGFVDIMDSQLVLSTPDEVVDREFRFAKIRASESIYRTAGGLMHGPGGESYYAAIWANDQAEYVNPFFPFLGYETGNESSLNAYMHFARFMNDEYKPIPSSIIAEGLDIWHGAGDRGDAAMIAYGASRYALARGLRSEAEQLWPLITWCLEYCRRNLTADGVVASDADELEFRFPAGKANLCTSTLYYDALLSSAALARELGKPNDYEKRARKLASDIEKYFGSEVGGFHTYRYYDGNTLLRSWICMPLIVGLHERAEGTIAALLSPALMTQDGLLTQEGSTTFWDRSTLYAIRGIFIAGETQKAVDFLKYYSARRLLGDHVPYPIEAWPEGSQRHLSAESGLFCRVITEGMFGIRPTGLRSFTISPRLPADWDKMSLSHIRAFDSDFDLTVRRGGKGLEVDLLDHASAKTVTYKVPTSGSLKIKLDY